MKMTQLIERMAQETGRRHGTVNLKHRLMREAGLITSGGRGRGGAEMVSRDIATSLLSEISIGETTEAANEVRRIGNLDFSYAEWINLSLLEKDFMGQDELGSVPYKHFGPLPPQLQHIDSPVTVFTALSRLLEYSVDPSRSLEIEYLAFQSQPDGVAVTISYLDRVLSKTAMNAFCRATGDRSDSMRFPLNHPDKPQVWSFIATFELSERQPLTTEIHQKLPGEVINRITQEALQK